MRMCLCMFVVFLFVHFLLFDFSKYCSMAENATLKFKFEPKQNNTSNKFICRRTEKAFGSRTSLQNVQEGYYSSLPGRFGPLPFEIYTADTAAAHFVGIIGEAGSCLSFDKDFKLKHVGLQYGGFVLIQEKHFRLTTMTSFSLETKTWITIRANPHIYLL